MVHDLINDAKYTRMRQIDFTVCVVLPYPLLQCYPTDIAECLSKCLYY